MIYFQGCTAREKLKNISRNTRKILDAAGIDYQVLDNEKCCGSVLLRTGFQEDAREVMENTFKELEDKKVVVSCAGCYRAFKEDYPEVLGEKVDVVHISPLLEELINRGDIEVEKEDLKVTYHDPCHLGRHMGEYEAPRNVIRRKANLVEMDKTREDARCCGAGGGVKSAYPDLSSKISLRRVDDALRTGAELLVTCCPFCVLNLESGKLKVMDLTEFILGEGF
ncbi:MAG TPA: (Fe-S)-binding protein [Methanobacteriaceae archaeon]|nr:(Fe-S)-binding protein [Methanobacteriaceae archaeon]